MTKGRKRKTKNLIEYYGEELASELDEEEKPRCSSRGGGFCLALGRGSKVPKTTYVRAIRICLSAASAAWRSRSFIDARYARGVTAMIAYSPGPTTACE